MENTTLKLKDFVYLLLATLANNEEPNIDGIKKAKIPANYKQIIENIMCAENGWKDKFSMLISIDDYFNDHFYWELELAASIKEVLIELNKNVEYNLENDELIIYFTQTEIDEILNKYDNDEIKEKMTHFASLLVDFIYTRHFQEAFYDYSAMAVKKMKERRNKEFFDGFCINKSFDGPKRVRKIFKKLK